MASPQFPYNDAVPQAAQKISATQKPILNNFQAINELINANHVGFSDVVNYGKHSVTTFPLQSIVPVSSANEMVLYAAAATSANGIELFYQYPSAGTVGQLTGSSGGTNPGTGSSSSQGWAYLVGNILLKWGTSSVGGVVTYPVGGSIPAYTTAVYNVQITKGANATTTYVHNLTLTNFTISTSGSFNPPFTWYSIGV